MTVASLFAKGKKILEDKNIDNYANEARWIFESVFEVSNQYLFFQANDEADTVKSEEFISKINRRARGEPVQYVIGSWDFYGETFFVGKGVLIPRPETELLIDFSLNYLKNIKNPVVFDLCSGTGCIGLTVARLIPDSKVFLIEKSDEAFEYLLKNKDALKCNNAEPISGDIFKGFKAFNLPKPDLILSNPPYIESQEIAVLQSEVLKEPVMALDGGSDGLDFYKAITESWLPYCVGAVAVECGENQHKEISGLFSDFCYDIKTVKDFNGIERVVCGLLKLRKDFYNAF